MFSETIISDSSIRLPQTDTSVNSFLHFFTNTSRRIQGRLEVGAIHALFQCFFSLSFSYVSIQTFVSFPSKCPTKRTSLFKISQSSKAFSALRARYRLHRQPYSYMIIYIFSNPLLYLPFAKFTHPTSALTCSVSSSPPCSYHSSTNSSK